MKRWTAILLSLALMMGLSARGQQAVPSASGSSQPSSIVVKGPEAFPSVSASSPEEESGSVPDMTPAEPEGAAGEHILIAYFTWAENTYVAHPEEVDIDATTSASVLLPGNAAKLALWIQERTSGNLFSIIVEELYSSDYDQCLDRAADEKAESARPKLVNHLENMKDYDTIFLGFPNWWYTLPMAVHSFLEEYDFSGKTIIPFCTHGTGGLAGTIRDLTAALPDSATVLEPIGVYRPIVKNKAIDIYRKESRVNKIALDELENKLADNLTSSLESTIINEDYRTIIHLIKKMYFNIFSLEVQLRHRLLNGLDHLLVAVI